jgi:hypothetical protein
MKKLTDKFKRTQVELMPGTNEVTDDEWKVMKVHLSREIEANVITTVEEVDSKTGEKAHDLKGMSTNQATTLVLECNSGDTLKKWYQEISNQEVRLTIVERMKELKIDVPKFTGTSKVKTEKTGGKQDGK